MHMTVDACTPVCPHPPFLVNWDGSVLKSNIPGQHCLPPSNGGNIRIWIFYCWNCHVSMNRLHTADWLINTSVYEMLDCNKRPWNAKFKMVETQALTLVWKYLNVSRCLYFSNKISVGRQNSHKNGIYIERFKFLFRSCVLQEKIQEQKNGKL